MMGLTVAPINYWWLAWVALIPLWLVINLSNSWRVIFLSCLMWAVGYHGIALSWILGIHPMTWMGVPWLSSLFIAVICWFLITSWGIILVAIWGVLLKFLFNYLGIKENQLANIVLKIILGVIIWCLLEKIWSYSPLWWTSLAFTQSPHNLALLQLLKISGMTTITSLILLVNFLFAQVIILSINQPKKSFLQNNYVNLLTVPISILLISHSVGYLIYLQPLNDNLNQQIKIGIIQGNIPNEIKLYPEGLEKAIAGYTEGYQELVKLGVDVVLTPETALPFYYEDIEQDSEFYRNILTYKTPVWLGAFDLVNNDFTNSLFYINTQGKLVDKYDKVNLVPLGEYIPFNQILGNLIDRLSPLEAHLIAGNKNQIFDSDFGRVIVGICYDSAFAEHFRKQTLKGGKFIITSANNAHYSASMPSQHHGQDVMRAIENDRWMARATNTGYSAIVNPHGETIWLSEINQYQIFQGNIYSRQTITFYVRWGNWLIKVFLLIFLVILLIKIYNL